MSREQKPDLARWQPKELIDRARALPLADFMLRCEAAFMLVVMVQAGEADLCAGLHAGIAGGGEVEGLAFRTETRDLSATMSGDVAVRTANAKPRLFSSEQTSERLPAILSRASCFVVPICKRAHVSFLQHISVGRARNHDIVLRHRSVSKFHAWFELDQEARLFVKDCESSNHTFVNDRQIGERTQLHPGDTVKFGTVETRVCTSEGLWRLMRS